MLEVSVGAVPRNAKKAKKSRNAKKTAGKLLREEEGLGRRVPSGSAESEADAYNRTILDSFSCRDVCNHVYLCQVHGHT